MSSVRPRRLALATAVATSALGVALFAGIGGTPQANAPQLAPGAQLVTASLPRVAVSSATIAQAARSTKHATPSKAALKRLTTPKPPKQQKIRSRQLAVEFDPDASSADRAALREQYGVDKHDRVTGNVERWYLPQDGTERTTAEKLSKEPGVAVATPNHIYTLSSADPSFGDQWALAQTNDHDVDAPEAWAATDGAVTAPVTVAVVDTGVDIDHPDLSNQLWRNPGEYGPDGRGGRKESNGVDDDFDGAIDNLRGINAIDPAQSVKPSADPASIHGTHVAGIIAAQRDNNVGIAGVSKQARIMAVKSFDGRSGDDTSIIAGIDYAIRKGAQIINGSFGGWTDDAGTEGELLTSIIRQNPSVLFVFAAGNDGEESAPGGLRSYPCSAPADNVVCVGATDETDARASYSNWGADVDLSAPGSNILSTLPGNAYGKLSGTSMATPMVVGAAALLKSQTPSLTPVQIKERLARTADLTGTVRDGLAGRYNLASAAANQAPAAPTATAAIRVSTGILVYDAAPGGANKVQIVASGSAYDVTDRGARLTPGTGCTALTPTSARCTGVGSSALVRLGDLDDSFYGPTALSQSITTGTGGSDITTGDGNTGVTGGDGPDSVSTGDGRNTITTGGDSDFVHTGQGDDYVDTGDAYDTISTEGGDDAIHAGGDDDLVLDGAGSDRIYGDAGNDSLWVGTGGTDQGFGLDRDIVDGGPGNDMFAPSLSPAVWGKAGEGASYSGGSGVDTLSYGEWGSNYPLKAQIGTKTGNGFGGADAIASDIEVLEGSAGDDVLTGSDVADVLRGGPGNDKVSGGAGNDLLDEDNDQPLAATTLGNDELIGGAGTDTVDYTRPVMTRANHNVNSAITASLDGTRNDGAIARGENDLIASDVEGLTGGPLADTLRAGSYAATLEGGDGADTLVGGPLGDTINATDNVVDSITCGGGDDLARRDPSDTAAADCERASNTPTARFTGGTPPAGSSTPDRQPAFEFTAAGGPDVTFDCRLVLDGGTIGPILPCVSGYRPATPLPDGTHTMIVRAKLPTTAIGNPALRTFTVDTVAPDTTLASGPPQWHESDVATFTLSSSEAKVSYECRLDDERWRRCDSTETYSELANGSHEFDARATDAADNLDPTPLVYRFVSSVETPQTKLTKTPVAATAQTSASFEFSAAPTSSTFECKLDAGAWAACTSPKSLTGLATGSHTFSVRGVNSGIADPTPATYTWKVDPTVAPTIGITLLTPGGFIGSSFGVAFYQMATTQPRFAFTSDQASATFECAVNSTPGADLVWTPCTSPWTSPVQSPTAQVAYVFRAKSAAGTYSEQPSLVTTFDLNAPTTTITKAPDEGETTAIARPEFSFKGTDDVLVAGYQCRIDGGAWTSCSSPYTAPTLAVGAHAIDIRARDRAGNVDATPEHRGFNVVAPTTPDTQWVGITKTGSRLSDLSPTLRFKALPTGGRFECAAGPDTGAAFAPCTSPWTVPQQTDGTWGVFQVRAIGPTGLVDPSPAAVAYQFDGTAPDTTITAGPAAGSTIATTSTSLSFTSESVATFECSLDAGAWAACTSPRSLTGLSTGSHTFSVRARDTAGNLDPTPATRTFTVTPSQLLTVGDPVAAPATATLTSDAALGTAVDWIHWSGAPASSLDRKSGTAVLPTWTPYAGDVGVPSVLTGSTTFSWTNATGTTPSGSATTGAANGAKNGRGFVLTIPATNADTRKLKLWIGVRGATTTGALTAKFGTQTALLKSFAGNSNTAVLDRTVTIDYRPLTATDTLTVSWYQGGGTTTSASQVVLYAAALY